MEKLAERRIEHPCLCRAILHTRAAFDAAPLVRIYRSVCRPEDSLGRATFEAAPAPQAFLRKCDRRLRSRSLQRLVRPGTFYGKIAGLLQCAAAMQLLHHRCREIPHCFKSFSSDAPLLPAGTAGCNCAPRESPRRTGVKPPVFRPVGEFQQRILIVPIAVYHHRDCRLSLSPQPGPSVPGPLVPRALHIPEPRGGSAHPAARRSGRSPHRKSGRSLREGQAPYLGPLRGDPPRSVSRGKINGNDV